MRGDGAMQLFTIGLLLFLGGAIMEGKFSTNSTNSTDSSKKAIDPTSSENLSIGRWNPLERQTHDYRMRTDSTYKYEVELNLRRGQDLEDSILDTLKDLGYERY